MIVGWHRQSKKFLKKNRAVLNRIPVALFITAISLTKKPGSKLAADEFFFDPKLIKSPRRPDRLGFKEKHTTPDSYLRPIFKILKSQKPIGLGIFGGKLDYTRLNFLQMLFVMLIIQAKPGDFRNWDAIQNWGATIQSRLKENRQRS
jgi:menaquinone-dependent protoporphyrinogen IX oxidase